MSKQKEKVSRRGFVKAATFGVATAGLGLTALRKSDASLEDNKAVVRHFIEECFNKMDVAAADKFIAANFVDHSPFPGSPPNLEGLKQGIKMYFSAFPDTHFEIEDLIAEGDKVVVRGTGHGTNKGPFMGMAATGKKIAVKEIHIVRISGGKFVEHWGLEDNMSMMQQLGMMPPMGEGAKK